MLLFIFLRPLLACYKLMNEQRNEKQRKERSAYPVRHLEYKDALQLHNDDAANQCNTVASPHNYLKNGQPPLFFVSRD